MSADPQSWWVQRWTTMVLVELLKWLLMHELLQIIEAWASDGCWGGTLWFGGERREFLSGESQRAAGRRGWWRQPEWWWALWRWGVWLCFLCVNFNTSSFLLTVSSPSLLSPSLHVLPTCCCSSYRYVKHTSSFQTTAHIYGVSVWGDP